jgi:hypothetical protein
VKSAFKAAALAVTALAALLPSAAQGQVKKQLAFVPLKAAPEATSFGDACNAAIRDELGKLDTLLLVDPAEIAARLDLEGKNTPGCIADSECVISNGDLLGIDGVMFGTVSRRADIVTMIIKLFLVKDKREDRTFSAEMVGEPSEAGALAAKAAVALVTGQALPEVQVPPPQQAYAPKQKEVPGAMAAPSRKTSGQARGKAKQPEEKKRIWSWVSLSLEAATLASAISCHVLAYQTNDEIHKGGKTKKQIDDLISTGNTEMISAYVMYGLAAAAAGVTIFFFWWESDRGTELQAGGLRDLKPVMAYDPLSNGAYLGLGGRF